MRGREEMVSSRIYCLCETLKRRHNESSCPVENQNGMSSDCSYRLMTLICKKSICHFYVDPPSVQTYLPVIGNQHIECMKVVKKENH